MLDEKFKIKDLLLNMKTILEYLLSNKNKKSYDNDNFEYVDFIDRLSEYNDDSTALDNITELLKKIGKCYLLDIVTSNIIKLLDKRHYTVLLNRSLVYGGSNFNDSYITVFGNIEKQYVSFEIYTPFHENVKLIEISSKSRDLDKFELYFVRKMDFNIDLDSYKFIKNYKNFCYINDNDNHGITHTVNKDDRTTPGMEKLKESFEYLLS